MNPKMNHLAIWLLIFMQQGIGALWYSSYLFGNHWIQAQGKSVADFEATGSSPFVISLLGTLASTYFIAWLLQLLKLHKVVESLSLVLVMWACIVFTEHATHYAFMGFFPQLLVIDMGKVLVCYALVAIVLSLWPVKSRHEWHVLQ